MTSLQKLEELRKKEERLLRNQQADNLIRFSEQFRIYGQDYSIIGTPQFARQARMAFMARAFCGVLQKTDQQTMKERPGFTGGYRCIYAINIYCIHGI